jgi:hypothetical protein
VYVLNDIELSEWLNVTTYGWYGMENGNYDERKQKLGKMHNITKTKKKRFSFLALMAESQKSITNRMVNEF